MTDNDAGYDGATIDSTLGRSHFAVHSFEGELFTTWSRAWSLIRPACKGIAALADALENTEVPLSSSLRRGFSVRVFYDASLPQDEGR